VASTARSRPSSSVSSAIGFTSEYSQYVFGSRRTTGVRSPDGAPGRYATNLALSRLISRRAAIGSPYINTEPSRSGYAFDAATRVVMTESRTISVRALSPVNVTATDRAPPGSMAPSASRVV